MNYLLTLAYNGEAFHGWQRQDNAVTVQQTVEEAVEKLFLEKATVNGCSRTDTGVHANCFKCNFHTQKYIAEKNVVSGLNFFLPDTVSCLSCETVDESFHARFDCKSKEYIYRIYNAEVRNPFYEGRAFFYKYKLDEKLLNEEAKAFIGTHDFTAFRAAGATVKTTVRTIYDASVERYGDEVVFRVSGDGFLYNMVRIMVGTLIYISEGKIPKGTISDIIESKDRLMAGMTIAPHGLYLNDVCFKDVNKIEHTK